MNNDVERMSSLAGLSEAVKAFDEYDRNRRFVRSGEFVGNLETPVERAARLRKQSKKTRAKRINKKKG